MSELIDQYQEAIRNDDVSLQNELRLKITEERETILSQKRGNFEKLMKDRRILQRKQRVARSKAECRLLYKESYKLYKEIETELLLVRQIKKQLRESM